MKINQGTKFGTLKKPMFSFFDVIIFLFNGKIEQNILGTTSSEQSENNRPPFGAKKEIIAPGYYSRKYGIYL